MSEKDNLQDADGTSNTENPQNKVEHEKSDKSSAEPINDPKQVSKTSKDDEAKQETESTEHVDDLDSDTKVNDNNNPEAITESLKQEPDNLMNSTSDKSENFQEDSDGADNDESKFEENASNLTENKGQSEADGDGDGGTTSNVAQNNSEAIQNKNKDNNPEEITASLKNEPDNLMNGAGTGNNGNEDRNEIPSEVKNTEEGIDAEQSVDKNQPINSPEQVSKTMGEGSDTYKNETVAENDTNNPEDITKSLKQEPENLINATSSETDEETNHQDKDKAQEPETLGATQGDKNKKQDEEHVKDIEDSNAEDAEDTGNDERHNIETKDYSKMSMAELNSEFEKLLKSQKVQTIKNQVNDLRTEFKSQFDALLDEKKEEFVADGGNEIDFYYSSSEKKQFNTIYREYKEKLNAYYKDLEKNLKANLQKRNEIIEEIKGLINIEENINTTYKNFKDLQEQWRNAGPIPRDKYNNTWNTYHHHVEIFYDFLHLNRDLRDMDFKHNLEQKLKIIERAEELAADNNINRSFRELQVLHKMWKEDLGPVAKEKRDEIWERFSAATKKIHDKRQAYYADLDKAYEVNLVRKEEIISKIEAVAQEEAKTHGAWQKKIKTVEALRQDFFNAGKVPKNDNEPTWQKFKGAVRNFNKKKNAYYKNLKQQQYKNLQKKLDLIKIAEDNMNSEDFETVTPLMKKIQSDWKNIGHVPRKDSDKIWKQFKNACNEYFNKMHQKRKEDNKELYDAFDQKSELLETVKGLKLTGKPKEDNKTIKEQISAWKALGEVPHSKRYIEGKFNKAINDLFDKLKMDKQDIEMIKYENKLEHLSQPEGTGLLDNEQNFIRKKIDEIKGEINQLENNMQFFSNASEGNPLFKEVNRNLERHREDLQLWEDKLDKLRKMY